MDTQLLTVFIECMRKRSFAAVARDQNVNPATISRSIQTLEEQLRLKLFQRSTRKIEPTEAGIIYFERVEPLMEEFEKAKLQAFEVNNQPVGTLRISAPVSFAHLNIIPLLPEFSKRFPELKYDLLLTDATLDLIEEHIDVAIRVGPLDDSSMICQKLSDMQSRVVATPQYIETHGRPENPEALAEHDCLLLAHKGFAPAQWKFTSPHAVTKEILVKESLRTSNAMALKECALHNMGIALLATWIIGRELEKGTLVDLFPDYEVTSSKSAAAWVLYPSRRYLPKKVEVFTRFLQEKFSQGTPWEKG